jgi:hypothetical protein
VVINSKREKENGVQVLKAAGPISTVQAANVILRRSNKQTLLATSRSLWHHIIWYKPYNSVLLESRPLNIAMTASGRPPKKHSNWPGSKA